MTKPKTDLMGWNRNARTRSALADSAPIAMAAKRMYAPSLLHGASAMVHATPPMQADNEANNSHPKEMLRRREAVVSISEGT